MNVHSSLLVQSKHSDRAVRSCSKMGSSRISWRCFSSRNGKKIMEWSNPRKQDAHCVPWWQTVCNSQFNELDSKMHVGHPVHLLGSHGKPTLSLRSMYPALSSMVLSVPCEIYLFILNLLSGGNFNMCSGPILP